ncbi:MAG TPA: DUF4276 family protein [Pirellulales bacterium]|nr:DUF4276 family protein [Pirellulales bacterium]
MTDTPCRFGLVVTGKGEEEFLHILFRSLMARAYCFFTVIRRVGQRSPITAPKKMLKMTGTNRRLPTKDEEEIGLPVLMFLRRNPGSYAIIVDDLEGARRGVADAVFARYRTALDEALGPPGLTSRAAVHFLVNMLEAYYFADSRAVNQVAGSRVIAADYPTDVEQIGHPKYQLKQSWPGFDEKAHGGPVLKLLDIERVLSRSAECCWLRAMFAWCVAKLLAADAIHDTSLCTAFCLTDGCQAPTTSGQ